VAGNADELPIEAYLHPRPLARHRLGRPCLRLAPTGKARVRMEQSTRGLELTGYTIAQFLSPHRYDGTTGRYHLSDKPTEAGAHTVIIDGCWRT
jgi:hypothetical protein